jgi:hypothetical protein
MLSYPALQTEVTARLGNRNDIASRVGRWINYAYYELLMNPRFNFFELDSIADFYTVPNQSYINVANLPTDFWHILGIRDVTNNRKLRRSHWQVFDRLTPTFGQPTRYSRFGPNIEFDPIPDLVYLNQMRYRARPPELADNTNYSALGIEWEEPLITLSTIKGFEALEQPEKAAAQRQMLEPMLQTREDVPMLEDEDNENAIEPAIQFRA